MNQNETSLPRGRGALIALWVVQVLLAAMFLMAGGSKLAGAAAMVTLYDTIGWGQWFRYVTGIIEVTAGITLLIPAVAVFGAFLIIPTMLGAIIASVTVLHASPAIPCVLLLGAAIVAWARRRQLPMF
jgi:putative oxidoreductase